MERDDKGRFVKGNKTGKGRKPGTAWSAWQAAGDWLTPEKLLRWLDELDAQAQAGDVRCIGILLDRFLPARLGVDVLARTSATAAVLPMDWRPEEPVSAVPPELWIDAPESEPPGPTLDVEVVQ
jgi:hypothetical protein